MSRAKCPGVSPAISAQFTFKMCVAAKNRRKINKKPYFEGSRAWTLTAIKSLSPVLVTISTMYVPVCNRFYARKQRLSHRNSVCLSVRLSVTRVDQAKTVQARITKSSPSAAGKNLVSGTVKLFHKFEGGQLERGR